MDPSDSAAANATLRECFDKVVIDRPEGLLCFYWRHAPGEPTELVFDYKAYSGFTSLEDTPS